MPDQPNDRPSLQDQPGVPAQERSAAEEWKKPPEEETDPSKLVDIADPSSAPESGAY